jgi:membrane protein DedA with SNARE-associated domain
VHEIQALLAQHGLALVFGNVLLAQLGVPLPAVPMLVVAGALAAGGQLSLAAILGVSVAGSLLGDVPWYYAGRRFGYRILRTLCRIAIEPDSCVKQTENIFERWGAPSLLVAKFIPGFSTVAPPLAGATRVGPWRFLALSAAGALLWTLAPVLAGYVLSQQVELALDWLSRMGAQGLMLVAAFVAVYIAIKLTQRHLLIRYLRSVRVSVDELLALRDSGKPLLVLDARSGAARKADPRHIPGALVIDLAAVNKALHHEQHDQDIVVYCS